MSNFFILKIVFENVVCEIAAILSREDELRDYDRFRKSLLSHWANSTGVLVRYYFPVCIILIRLAAVSYRGKKVRHTKLRPKRASACEMCHLQHYFILQSPRINLCDLVWQIRHNYSRLDDGHCDVTGHRMMLVLGAVGTMVTTHKNFVMMWSFKGPKLFCVL